MLHLSSGLFLFLLLILLLLLLLSCDFILFLILLYSSPLLGDLWNLKYLSGFKWSHLTEKVAYERRVREQKLRIEMLHARKENAAYVQQIEMGQKLDYIEERMKKNNNKGNKGDIKSSENDGGSDEKKKRKQKSHHHKHRQHKPIHDGSDRPTKSALLNSLL